MSWTTLSPDHRCRARKPHRCDVCDELINKGDEQVTRSGVSEDGKYRMHMHPECEEFSSREYDYSDWECGPGGISRAEVIEANADHAAAARHRFIGTPTESLSEEGR